MSSFPFYVQGAVLDARVVTEIGEILRPYSLPYYERWKSRAKQGDEETVWVGNEQRKLVDVIASGGTYDNTGCTATEPSGVEHTFGRLDFPLDRITDFARVSFKFETPSYGDPETSVAIDANEWGISATIKAAPENIKTLSQDIRTLLESVVDQEKIRALLPQFRVFIGHGGDNKWEVVRDYISDAGYEIESFESDTRAGEMTLAVVEQMVSRSTVAVLVMTGVDALKDGRLLARQNVVHEIGLAQGLLGIANTIVLLENGTEEFTNIQGLTQVRFAVGEIHRTKPEVLATLANHARRRGYPQA